MWYLEVVSLQSQEGLFQLQSAAVAGEGAVRPHHPVAGDEDGNGVIVVGHAHRPEPAGAGHRQGDVPVGADLAPGDGLQSLATPGR